MEDCTVTTETIDGIHHTYYSRDGIVVAECRKSVQGFYNIERWYRDGKLHRDDGPAEISYFDDQLDEEYWYRHGKLHRKDGPAEIWYECGQIIKEYWCRDDKLHREDGPAEIYYENGQIDEEYWRRDGKLCPTGVLTSAIYNNITSKVWYYMDDKSTQDIDEFRDAVKGDAIHDALRPLPIPIRQAIIPHYCYQ